MGRLFPDSTVWMRLKVRLKAYSKCHIFTSYNFGPLGHHGDTYIWLKWSHKSVIYHTFLSSKPIYSHNMVPKCYPKFHNSKVWPLSFQTHIKSHSYTENRDNQDVMVIMKAPFMICLITFSAKDTYLMVFQSRMKWMVPRTPFPPKHITFSHTTHFQNPTFLTILFIYP